MPIEIEEEFKDDAPYLVKKNVILARSGIQTYSASDIVNWHLGEPPFTAKESYSVHRPASLLLAKKALFASLPVTKEHPAHFVNGDNHRFYANGVTGEKVTVEKLESNEIGLKSSIIFNTFDIYDYYLQGNKEVSVGYKALYEWNKDNSDGIDIRMTDIFVVNHCAVTAKGRAGALVAVIDSLVGGLTMFKSGLFHKLLTKGKSTDSNTPFSTTVFAAIESTKGKTTDAVQAACKATLDSIATLKDGESKSFLASVISDCFIAPDSAIAHKAEVAKTIDSVYTKAEKETLDAVPADTEDTAAGTEDTAAEGVKDEEEKKEKKEGETKDGEDGKGKGTANIADSKDKKAGDTTDSAVKGLTEKMQTLDSGLIEIAKKIDAMVLGIDEKITSAVKTVVLGKTQDSGTTVDSDNAEVDVDLTSYVL